MRSERSLGWSVPLLTLALLGGCGERPNPPRIVERAPAPDETHAPPTGEDTSMTDPPRPLRPAPSLGALEPGPPITDPARLRAWLDEVSAPGADPRWVRLPVVITRSVLGVTAAHVGVRAEAPGDGALRLRLNDGALGISLADRLVEHFGRQPDTVAIWLEGVRSGGNPFEDRLAALAVEAGEPADAWPLSVLRVGEPVTPTDQARAFTRPPQ